MNLEMIGKMYKRVLCSDLVACFCYVDIMVKVLVFCSVIDYKFGF